VDEFRVIETPAEFDDAVRRLLEGDGPIAVDAERASGFRYSQRAYLIQMFRRGSGTFLFDPPQIPDFSALAAAISTDEWVLHAASQDLACLREVGLDPERIFDTELAARLLGMPRVGLASVVEELLDIKLAKEHSAADWSTRPLPQSWLKYAALDVQLLVDVRDRLAERLVETGKADLAAQEFDAVLHRAAKPPASEPWRRLSGIHAMRSPRNLAVARELWLARDGLAVERWNTLHPMAPQRTSYVETCLSPTAGPIVAASDYVRALPDLIRTWVPRRYVTLGTDGYGRSDTREALRRFFEVDRKAIVVAALKALSDEERVAPATVEETMTRYGIASGTANPWDA